MMIDGRALASPVDLPPLPVRLEGLLGEPLQGGLPLGRIALRHGRTVASPVVNPLGHNPTPRTPVLVGVGTASSPAPVTDLMLEAVQAAADDCGRPSLLRQVDRVAMPQGTWTLTDPARTIADRIGAHGARTQRYEVGVSQQEMINEALLAIASGETDVVLVVGGEARAWARDDGGEEVDTETRPPDDTVTRPPDFVAPIEVAAGIVWPPVQQYALIDNALAHHEQQGTSAHRQDVAALWSRFNQVAQRNPLAAFPAPRSATDIATPGPKNRPLAYPYNKWHSSQWTVDQSAALLLCSAERAQAAGVPPDRWVFPHVALHVSEAVTLTARRDLHAWPAMRALGRAAADHLGRPLGGVGIAEVYSCFPAAVRVQQRELGLDLDGTPTVTGGMSFAGGPFNNFVLGATAAVAALLRAEPTELGLVTTVSGMLSKPGLAVWSASPPGPATAHRRPGRIVGGRHPEPAGGAPRQPGWPGHGGLVHRDLRRAAIPSDRSGRRLWLTYPTGPGRPPPAMMQQSPSPLSPKASSARPSTLRARRSPCEPPPLRPPASRPARIGGARADHPIGHRRSPGHRCAHRRLDRRAGRGPGHRHRPIPPPSRCAGGGPSRAHHRRLGCRGPGRAHPPRRALGPPHGRVGRDHAAGTAAAPGVLARARLAGRGTPGRALAHRHARPAFAPHLLRPLSPPGGHGRRGAVGPVDLGRHAGLALPGRRGGPGARGPGDHDLLRARGQPPYGAAVAPPGVAGRAVPPAHRGTSHAASLRARRLRAP